MPLKLNVGLSKKVGLPDYGSLGASCNIELELDSSLLQGNLEGLHRHVQVVYAACAQAVQDELARHGTRGAVGVAANPQKNGNGNGCRNTQSKGPDAAHAGSTNGRGARHVSRKQIEYAKQLADRTEGLGLRGLDELTNRMFKKALTDLSSLEASSLIETLRDLDAGKIDVLAALGGAAA